MCAEPIPDEDQRPRQVLPEVLETFQNISAMNRMIEMPLEQFGFGCQSDHGRKNTPLADTPQDRRFPPGRPGRSWCIQKREAHLVYEDDLRAHCARFFKMRGQSPRSQARTSSSSRSRAVTSGT